MKKFDTLNEILAYQLEAMYVAEKTLQVNLTDCTRMITNKKLSNEFEKYQQSSADKRLKLKRIFSYLLISPSDRKGKPILKMLKEMEAILLSSTSEELKNAQFLGALQAISHYKTAVYSTAKTYSEQLELTTVSDLLTEIIAWEAESYASLTRIAIDVVTREAARLDQEA